MSRFVLTAQLQLQAPNNVAQVVRQIQSQLNNVNVNLNVQGTAQAQRQLQQVTAQTQAAGTAADRMGRAFAVSIRRFAAFSIATRAVGLFTSTLSDAVKSAIDFEREMVRVSQVTGQSISQLQFLSKAIKDLATGFGVSSKDLLTTGQLLLQAGVNAKDTEVALKTLAKAALAPNFDSLSETTEGAIAILAQFQEGVGALEKQLGAINAVAGAFAVEAGDLIDVIRRAGGVFKSSGGDLNELLALFTSVRATTRESAESIGTGLRTIFTRIQRPKTIEFLKQFGVELVDLEGKFVGPFEAVKRLSGALSGLGEGDITFIRIAEELGGFRQIGKVLPLLQQFSTAQAALNVANKSGNSLAQDAATAQQALAVRITKVKEEFLALVRGMTETKTFQIMANTALSLAEALIKIGEAIKPLLPLLAAVAAVNLAKGIGTFAGGLMRGMQSGRTYNKGGKVHHFARGGMVPGTGNRDTVPAMLQPGEFVIKKSSVNKLGAGNLAAMNENRYQAGGPMTTAQKIAAARAQNLPSNPNKQKTKTYKSGTAKSTAVQFAVDSGSIGAFFMNPAGVPDKPVPFKDTPFILKNEKLKSLAGITGKKLGFGDTEVSALLKSGTVSTFFPSLQDVSQGSFGQIVQSSVRQKLSEAVMDSASIIENQLGSPLNANKSILKTTASQRIQQDLGAIRTTSGYLFEGIIDALSGAKPASNQSTFDFPASSLQGNRKRLSALFGPLGKLGQADAKASFSTDIISGNKGGTLVSKIVNSINNGILGGIKMIPQRKNLGGIIQRFAKGGMAQAPLIDDIVNATGTVMPRPSSAIAALISAGGGAIDIDRTLKRTIGDKAYGMAKTSGQQSAALDKYFRDPQARLRDVTSAPLTTFGRELQTAIKSGQLQPGRLSIVSKSQRVPGVAEYLSQLFGIPLANMIFTGGGSKQPAMDALRSKGPRASRVARFAAGGGVGTDTVPALLTPGEFVVNRSSAQSIGYGNLNRMNKVGKYAKGGVVQNFAAGGVTATPASSASRPSVVAYVSVQSLTQNAQALKASTQAVQQNVTAQNQQKKSVMDVVSNNKMFAASMGISLLQGFLPAVDENSGALLKLSHSFLGLLTTIASVGFALEAFGVSLKKQAVMDFFGGKGLGIRSQGILTGVLEKGGLSRGLSQNITGVANGLIKLTGPLLAAAAASYAVIKGFNAVVTAFYDVSAKLNKAIEQGNVGEATRLAGQQYDLESGNAARAAFGTVGAVGGAAIGSIILPVIGTAIGAAVGSAIGASLATLTANFESLNILLGGNTKDSTIALAAAQAGAVQTQKELEKAQKTATNAMEDFQNGTISAAEALLKITSASSAAIVQEDRAIKAALSNIENRSYQGPDRSWMGYGRDVAATMTFGYVEGSDERNTRLGEQTAKIITDSLFATAKAFETATAARVATIRSGIAVGEDAEQTRNRALGVGTENDLLARQQKLANTVRRLTEAGDYAGAEAASQAFNQVTEQINQVDRELENLGKEMQRAKAALEAMNLGLRVPEATATAMSASMDRFVAGLEVGGSTFLANTEFLSSAMSSAAQAMDAGDIKKAVDDVAKNLTDMGVDPTKFRTNTEAFIQAQQNYNQAFDRIVGNLNEAYKSGRSLKNAPEDLKRAFAEELTAELGGDAKKNLTAIINGIELSPTEVEQILSGNLEIFGDKLGEAGKKQIEQIVKIAQERQKAEQVVIGLINQRAEAERNLAAAQKEAINLYMEGRDVQAKYGGQAVTSEERLAAILARANAGAGGMGLRSLRTGNVGELRLRNAEILRAFSGIEARRSRDGGMQGREGADASNVQQDLAQAQKDQVQTIRDLIKFQEEELRIVQEKNKLEKESMESLITGDIEKFFEQQSTIGAQAAIATGDTQFANLFGADVLGKAFQNMQRQMEAGVQSLFGQQLVGPGGLVERAATTALASRGVTDPRAAQALAGTTAEEEALKRTLQDLGQVLGETGQVGAAMAEMQVQTAQINVARAELKLSEIEERGRRLAGGMSNGGMVYASRGMFVPRGTDTVPAMLTPGEFVVRREAVNRGNNLQLLRAINNGGGKTNGFAKGGKVGYYNNGGMVQYKALGDLVGKAIGIDSNMIANLGAVFNKFVSGFNESIKNLQNTKLQVKLDSVNVNVNLNSSSMLNEISQQAKQNIIGEVIRTLRSEYGIGSDGKLEENKSSLPRPSIGS